MKIAILDYKAGNVTSVLRAIQHLGFDATITPDPDQVCRADKVIFPGVGAAASCMTHLKERGLDQALRDVAAAGTPLLGICVGMQLLFEHSAEDGGVDCVGLLPGQVKRFQPSDKSIKVPHMGWNTVHFADDILSQNIEADSFFYFVHSFYCAPEHDELRIATSHHGQEFCAGVRKDNVAAMQFHPEKSGPVGLQLLRNFLEASA